MKRIVFIFLFIQFFSHPIFAQQWFTLNQGLFGSDQYDQVNTLCADSTHNRLWASGSFQIAGSDSVHNIAWWDGFNWNPLMLINASNDTVGIGYDAEITSSIMYDNRYVFSADVIPNLFSRWRLYSYDPDSLKYKILGTFDEKINAMCIYNDTLYVAGNFTNYENFYSGVTSNMSCIAKWNGFDFVPVGSGTGFYEINSLCVHNNKLIAAGLFESVDGLYCKNIAQWDGAQWSPIGTGIGTMGNFSDYIFTVCSYNGILYAGGIDITIGNGNDLVFWNGSVWESASSFYNVVTVLNNINNRLYVGASTCWDFVSTNSPWYCVAQFNGANWSATGKGPLYNSTGNVVSIVQWNDSIYFGGRFIYIGDTPYTYTGFVARYDPTLLPITNNINVGICEGDVYDFNGISLSTNGIYYDTLIASSGVDSIVILNLSVTSLNSSININGDTLMAIGNGTIQWVDCNSSQQISGATNNTYIASTSGIYAAIITNGNCSDTTACVSYTSVNSELPSVNGVTFYPNPSSKKITVEWNGIVNRIELKDLLGRIVLKQTVTPVERTKELNLSNLNSGIYFLTIKTVTGNKILKIIKE